MKRTTFWLPSLFVTLLGCSGAASNEHHYVSPTLPPMEESTPTNPRAPTSIAQSEVPPAPAPAPVAPVVQSDVKEPGRASGPCPSATDSSPQILRQAFEMEKKTTDPEPHHAIAEAIRMRLDALFQHGCFRRLNDDQLLEAIVQIADNPQEFKERLGVRNHGELGIIASYGTYWSGFLAHYRWHDGMIRTSILVTGEQGDMDKQLYVLTSKVVKLPSYPDPVVVLGNTHPWVSSCWRAMRIRILAPSGDPFHPKALLDKPVGGRWCEGMTSVVEGDSVSFSWEDWGGPWSMALVQRPYTYKWQWTSGKMVEHFGFPPRFENLPEDWLMREWTLSQEATVDTARDRLQPLHDKLHQALVNHKKAHPAGSDSAYTQEMFPVSDTERKITMYCAGRENDKPCKEWPKPVDFFVERRANLWYVKDVVPRK